METPLLQTKLYIPSTRPELVARPRLIARLSAGLLRKLTLISAPAGFGKTTLVSDWVNQKVEGGRLNDETGATFHPSSFSLQPSRVAWLSLDDADNDPVRFLTYVVAALQTTEVNIGKGTLSALQAPQPPPTEAILTALLNEVAALPDQIILVLDDYHLIEAPLIHDALTFLLEHLPPQMHLVIVTREDPLLPLARLRARNQLTELRAIDLRFTAAEAAAFLNQVMGLNLSTADIAALETRTEGWIAGLQLAAISMQGHEDTTSFITSFTGSHHFVLDYLIEEVLERQSESIQTFLLQTAILDQLSGPLCDAVVGIGDWGSGIGSEIPTPAPQPLNPSSGQEVLMYLERVNLFLVPLDDQRRWYRYHHLFADLLRQRLRQTQPDWVPTLHGRASEWYEQNRLVDEAIDHALAASDFERAATLIEDQFGANYERGEQTQLRRWLTAFPEAFVCSNPQLCLLHAWNLFTSGQLDAADQSLRAAEKMLDPDTDQALVASLDEDQLSNPNQMKLVGRIAAIRSFFASYSGDMPETIRYARQALAYLPEQELEWRSAVLIALGDAYAGQGQMVAAHQARSDALVTGKASGDTHLLMIVNLRLAEILRQQGKLQQVIDICERQWKSADENGMSESAVVGWLFGIWGEVLAECNDRDRAIDQATHGVKLAARGGDVLYEVLSNLCLVRVLFSRGDLTGAEAVLQSMEQTAREHDLPPWAVGQVSAWHVRIWLAQGKLEAAAQWVKARVLDPEGEPPYLHEMEYIVFARVLIAQGRLDAAARLLQRLLEAAEAGERTASVIEILMLQALTFQAGGDTTRAMTALERTLTLAEAGGFIRIFMDEGPPLAHLLYAAAARGIAADYAGKLLAAFTDFETIPATQSKIQNLKPVLSEAAGSEIVEPLSEREIEVLQLIAAGLTNQEIANRLYLSLNTVKVHTRNIYAKLGAHHRTGAVARARALGVLHPTGNRNMV